MASTVGKACALSSKNPFRKRKLCNAEFTQIINPDSALVRKTDGPTYLLNDIFDASLRAKTAKKTRYNKMVAFER